MLCKPGALEKVMAEHHVLVPTTVQCPGKKVDLWRAASVCPASVSSIRVVGFAGNTRARRGGSDGQAGQTPSSENLKVQTVYLIYRTDKLLDCRV